MSPSGILRKSVVVNTYTYNINAENNGITGRKSGSSGVYIIRDVALEHAASYDEVLRAWEKGARVSALSAVRYGRRQ